MFLIREQACRGQLIEKDAELVPDGLNTCLAMPHANKLIKDTSQDKAGRVNSGGGGDRPDKYAYAGVALPEV